MKAHTPKAKRRFALPGDLRRKYPAARAFLAPQVRAVVLTEAERARVEEIVERRLGEAA